MRSGESGGESTGHASGRRIVSLLRSKKWELGGDDYSHMRKVVGVTGPSVRRRHQESAWRYSLMNWGHNPCK
jgi:Protein of unknown function (DUF3140)